MLTGTLKRIVIVSVLMVALICAPSFGKKPAPGSKSGSVNKSATKSPSRPTGGAGKSRSVQKQPSRASRPRSSAPSSGPARKSSPPAVSNRGPSSRPSRSRPKAASPPRAAAPKQRIAPRAAPAPSRPRVSRPQKSRPKAVTRPKAPVTQKRVPDKAAPLKRTKRPINRTVETRTSKGNSSGKRVQTKSTFSKSSGSTRKKVVREALSKPAKVKKSVSKKKLNMTRTVSTKRLTNRKSPIISVTKTNSTNRRRKVVITPETTIHYEGDKVVRKIDNSSIPVKKTLIRSTPAIAQKSPKKKLKRVENLNKITISPTKLRKTTQNLKNVIAPKVKKIEKSITVTATKSELSTKSRRKKRLMKRDSIIDTNGDISSDKTVQTASQTVNRTGSRLSAGVRTKKRFEQRTINNNRTLRSNDTMRVGTGNLNRTGSRLSKGDTTRNRRGNRTNITNNNIVYMSNGVNASSHHPYISNRRHTRFRDFGSFNLHWGSYRHHRPVRPGYGQIAYYGYDTNYGSYFGLSYIYPGYHRKYIFVSLGGYWPVHYRYIRYYWYGGHPHRWYGAYPAAYPVTYPVVDSYPTYNTYNYYNDYTTDSTYGTNGQFDDFSDIREKLRLQELAEAIEESDKPLAETIADLNFEAGVKAFAEGNYAEAVVKFRQAVELAPEDMILPFAYCQGLFANGQYAQAASVLREALSNIPEDNETVFYPRGLYADDDELNQQIELLKKEIKTEPFDGDLKLLLGYQLIGVDEFDKAAESLKHARLVAGNEDSVRILVDLIEKIKTAETDEPEQQINLKK